jgi:hypothetical protein
MLPDELLNIIRQFGLAPDGADMLYHNSLFLEFIFWVIILAVAGLLLRFKPKWLDRLEDRCSGFARRKGLVLVSVIVLALAARLVLLLFIPIPTPIVHDEYSYILGAQTLAAGRLTNPSPALWVHFESFHINLFPTYQSMYPPGQAAMLALGIVLFGQPWWGVWLSIALMCAAITWMLQGWMPPPWALLGGLFCVLRFSTFSYWINSYWGGAVAASGGALVLGALARLLRKRTTSNALLLALGLVILANTRPYEGLVFSAPAMLYLLVVSFRKHWWTAQTVRRVLAPALALLVACVAFTLYYDWRGTSNPLLMPYMVNHRTYHISKPFLWQASYPIPHYNHRVMHTFYVFHELPEYIRSRHSWGLEDMEGKKVALYYEFFVWPLLLLTIFAVWAMMKSRRMRLFPITMLLFLAGLLIQAWLPHAHYAAPILCVVIATVLYGLRLLRTWKPRGIPAGVAISRAVVLVILVWSFFPLAQRVINPWLLNDKAFFHTLPQVDRARLIAQLERIPGQHLVIVHNHLSATGSHDWIYNEPDIDHARIVFARDMGPEMNQELLDYFRNRHIWLVDQDDGIMRLTPYDEETPERILAAAGELAQEGHKN